MVDFYGKLCNIEMEKFCYNCLYFSILKIYCKMQVVFWQIDKKFDDK